VSPTEIEPNDSPMKLLPHQAALVETFFNPASKRVILLRWDVGLGKSAALVALSSRLLQEQPTARALFLVPRVLQAQFVEMLSDAGAPVLLVDRYRFREMLDSTTDGEFWPSGVVAVLSRDFAKESDVLPSLVDARWDLVIVDEAHSFAGPQTDALQRIAASADRVVLASATLPDLRLIGVFPTEDATVVECRRDQVVDHDGAAAAPAGSPLYFVCGRVESLGHCGFPVSNL
jgi:superfamily II DNA or RNA helicase